MTKENPQKYQKSYPKHLDWERQIWLLEKGDRLKRGNELWEVVDLYRSPIPGKKPQIKLRRLDET